MTLGTLCIMAAMARCTLIIRTAGTNCDRELAHAFALAGSRVETVHLNRLVEAPARIESFDLIGIPGGFSYGDDIAAGRIFANRLKHRLGDAMRRAVDRGAAVIGICNGFQVLVKMGLLPDPDMGVQCATLADNAGGRFVDRWVALEADASSVCVWTRGMDNFELPIAHGEGRFLLDSDATLARLQRAGQIALRYRADDNPNGSVDGVAGICDASGRVFGLMPHPERYVHPTQHPAWTAPARRNDPAAAAGLRMMKNAVVQAVVSV